MPSTAPLSPLFNDFLFATVCEERGETPLSVVSALARLGLDPWSEAADLARLPADGAARRLSSLLAGVANPPDAPPDHATLAARLVALLPAPANVAAAPLFPAADALTTDHIGLIRTACLFFLASMAVSVLLADLGPRAAASAPPPGEIPTAVAHR